MTRRRGSGTDREMETEALPAWKAVHEEGATGSHRSWLQRVISASFVPGEELRSHFVVAREAAVPSDTEPCAAPEGVRWVWARSRRRSADRDPLAVGKWLIRVTCRQASYCWGRVRAATEEGTLGIGAKVSTDWGKARDPAGHGRGGSPGWPDHVICIYTADWRDRDEVARVGRRLGEIDAARKQGLMYKPDAFTYAGMYSRNAPGEIAIYSMPPPYTELYEHAENLAMLRTLLGETQTCGAEPGS
jgi:hypothetical protein